MVLKTDCDKCFELKKNLISSIIRFQCIHAPYSGVVGFCLLPSSFISDQAKLEGWETQEVLQDNSFDSVIYCSSTSIYFAPSLFRTYLLGLSDSDLNGLISCLSKFPDSYQYFENVFDELKKHPSVLPAWVNKAFKIFENGSFLQDVNEGSPDQRNCPHQKIIQLYHEVLPGMPQVKDWNQSNRSNLLRIWREDPQRQTLDWWFEFFDKSIKSSDFLMGKKTDFQANLGWIIRPKNFSKILNGMYVNRESEGYRTRVNKEQIQKAFSEHEQQNELVGHAKRMDAIDSVFGKVSVQEG